MAAEGSSTLAEILRDRKAEVLARWSSAVRSSPTPRHMDEAKLRDSLPVLLDFVIEAAEDLVRGASPGAAPDIARVHALQRLESGYAIDELVLDYTALRASAYEAIEGSGKSLSIAELRLLDRVIDRVMNETVSYFVGLRDRRIRAFDRLVSGMAGSNELQAMLDELIAVFLDSVPSVDTVTVLIADGDRLVVRATKGLEREKELGFSLRFGEGFAGTVAATREARLLHDASRDPLVKSPTLRARGVRALYGVPLVHDGRVIGVVSMGSRAATDFADEDLMLFRALANRAASVIAQAHLVEQLTRTAHFREQFVGVVSHDLRSPLNAIVLGANVLLHVDEAPPQVPRTAARIARSADRIRRMIDQLLDFTRVRLGGGLTLDLQRARIDDLCREVIGEVEIAHPARAIAVTTRGDLEGRWDTDRLKQLVSNLVENAVTHGVHDSPVKITLDGTHPDDVVLRVHNMGAAIPAAELAEMFEPFRQAVRTRAGLGLGLYIAQQVALAHGGTIDVSSSDADGTAFVVRLPRRR